MTDRSVELVIDGYCNPRHKVKAGIPQGSPVSRILFLIYISEVFSQAEEKIPRVKCISFIDDLGFIIGGWSSVEVGKILEKAGKSALEWEANNLVTYDTSKTEAILFSKARPQKLAKQLFETQLTIDGEIILFNKNATRWLRIWLDNQLSFTAHVNERMEKARAAEVNIKGLSKIHGLPPALVQRFQIAAVQSIALYGAELWWKGQKCHQNDLQKLINRQARSITGMLQSTPIFALMSEAGLVPAHIVLDFRQRSYALRILSLPELSPTKDILSITLCIGDGNAQPEDQPECDFAWATSQRVKTLGQRLARQVSVGFSMDPAEGTEPILDISLSEFPGEILIEEKKKAMQTATGQDHADLTLWCDGSKLDSGRAGAAVIWRESGEDNGWRKQNVTLGKIKEILDAELWGISEAVKIAE